MIRHIHTNISGVLKTTREFNLTDCDRLLALMEKAGMNPPTYLYKDGDLGSKYIQGWEPEDE